MNDPGELALVLKAITCRVTGCLMWHPKERSRVRKDPVLKGLTPAGIQESLICYVENGGEVRQVPEKQPHFSHRTYYYKATIPYPELFCKGLFVEMELYDADEEVPVVLLVNAHEQQ
jgi:hypothetical protein